jgi:hypothetical protein
VEADSAGELVEKNDTGSGERAADIRTTVAVRDALSRSQATAYRGFLAIVPVAGQADPPDGEQLVSNGRCPGPQRSRSTSTNPLKTRSILIS